MIDDDDAQFDWLNPPTPEPPKPAPKVLDLPRARRLRDEGISRVVGSAERETSGWSDAAYEFFVAYARQHPEFMTEDVRVASEAAGVPPPPNLKAWGGVVARARRAGIIQPDRYEQQRSVTCHGSPKPVWRSLVRMV